MGVAVGKEWNTNQTFKRLVQPQILTKAGQVIKPLKYKEHLTPKAIEALVANKKNQLKPAAKF